MLTIGTSAVIQWFDNKSLSWTAWFHIYHAVKLQNVIMSLRWSSWYPILMSSLWMLSRHLVTRNSAGCRPGAYNGRPLWPGFTCLVLPFEVPPLTSTQSRERRFVRRGAESTAYSRISNWRHTCIWWSHMHSWTESCKHWLRNVPTWKLSPLVLSLIRNYACLHGGGGGGNSRGSPYGWNVGSWATEMTGCELLIEISEQEYPWRSCPHWHQTRRCHEPRPVAREIPVLGMLACRPTRHTSREWSKCYSCGRERAMPWYIYLKRHIKSFIVIISHVNIIWIYL